MYQIRINPVGTSRNTGFSSGGRSISLISQSLGWKVCRGSKSASFMARRLIGVLRDVERAKQVGVLLLGSRLSLFISCHHLRRLTTLSSRTLVMYCSTLPCFFFVPCPQHCGGTCTTGRVCWYERLPGANELVPSAYGHLGCVLGINLDHLSWHDVLQPYPDQFSENFQYLLTGVLGFYTRPVDGAKITAKTCLGAFSHVSDSDRFSSVLIRNSWFGLEASTVMVWQTKGRKNLRCGEVVIHICQN